MNKLAVLANDNKANRTRQDREHECFSCHKYHDNLINEQKLEKFPCQCGLSTDIKLAESLASDPNLTSDEKIFLEYAIDPVAWADFEFNWKARWYQEELLRCSSLKRVIRAGRRIGKSESLAVDALHKACTNDNFKVLIIAPAQIQVEILFRAIDRFIEQSLTIKGLVSRTVQSPAQVREFSNGSMITGITAGVSSGAGANRARGQDAHAIYLDETDMLSKTDLDSILGILASHPNVFLWASGTPSGKREHFYQWSRDKKLGFKEFHYASWEGPDWTKELEDWFKAVYSENVYDQEFGANFGADEQGVFNKDLVDQSIAIYDSKDRFPEKDVIYGMGIDWNDTDEGVHIVIVGFDKQVGKFKFEKKVVISKQQFTQTKAVEKIIELNAVWNPSFIYVDSGFGHTQVELLRAYGIKHPETKIARKLKPIAMGGKIEIKDPIYGMVKKDTKPFIVNLTSRRFEQEQIILPRDEYRGDGTEGLVDQILMFRIKRYSQDGRPIYDNTADHTLTAWMLAIYGFWIEHTDITGRKNVSTTIGFAGPGQPKPQSKTSEQNTPFGLIKIEIPEDRERQKKQQKTAHLVPRPRNININHGNRNLSDIAKMQEQRGIINKRLGSGNKTDTFNYFAKKPPGRKSF